MRVRIAPIARPCHRSALQNGVRQPKAGTKNRAAQGFAAKPCPFRGDRIVDRLARDGLVLLRSKRYISMGVQLVRAGDRPRVSVAIRVVLFEVRTGRGGAALSVLGGQVGVSLNAGVISDNQFGRIATSGLSAVLFGSARRYALSGGGRPPLRALSGATVTINLGSEVPTVRRVTYSDYGPPIPSIEYRDSGVSLTMVPTVRRREIKLRAKSERPLLSGTETDVNYPSTSSKVSLAPGKTVAIARLDERSDNNTGDGSLGGQLGSRKREPAHRSCCHLLKRTCA